MVLGWQLYGELIAARPAWSVRGVAALVLMFVLVTAGLLLVNICKRFIQRSSDTPRRPRPYSPPPVDDWARKPLVAPLEAVEGAGRSDGDRSERKPGRDGLDEGTDSSGLP